MNPRCCACSLLATLALAIAVPHATMGAAPDPCGYAYAPSTVGMTWEYAYVSRSSVTGRPPTEITTRTTVRVVGRSGDRVRFSTAVVGNGADQEASYEAQCAQAGPVLLPSRVGLSEVRWRGVEVPRELAPGLKWTRVMEVRQPRRQTLETSYEAVAEEAVSVPAGRFQAVKVTFAITERRGTRAAAVAIVKGANWYARGVGLVRAVSEMTSRSGGTVVKVETAQDLAAVRPASAFSQ